MSESKQVPKQVLIAGLFHETHTFLDGVTSLADCSVLRAEELLAARGDASPVGGALEAAAELGWRVVPTIDVRALPGPMVSDEVVETWWHAVQATIQSTVQSATAARSTLDGIFLVLHGAMVSQSLEDVEGEMLARLRALVGPDVPIGGVTDLHANFSPRMARNSNALVTYRENPHTDAHATAARAAILLDSIMHSGARATTVFEQTPILWPPTGTATAAEPMSALEALAREIEAAEPEILAVNVHAGYSFADVRDAGVSFSAITSSTTSDSEQKARRALQHLSEVAWQKRHEGNVVESNFDASWPEIRAVLNAPGKGPIVIAEPSDNIGGGAPGDGTGLLRALLAHQVAPAAVVLNDPRAVAQLQGIAPGQRVRLPVGGASGICGAGPLELDLELVSTSDGRFTLEDENSHLASMCGRHIAMGPSATVRHNLPAGGAVYILLTSYKTAPFDLGQLRSQGIPPEAMAVIGVKAAVAHRRAYDPIARASFSVSTPGVCSSNLKGLPFRHLRRPIFPIDELPR